MMMYASARLTCWSCVSLTDCLLYKLTNFARLLSACCNLTSKFGGWIILCFAYYYIVYVLIDLMLLNVPPRFQLWSAAPNRTTSPYFDHTEKKTHAVWSSGQNGWVGRRQENSDCSSPEWVEKASWTTSWMVTLKNDLALHNLTLEDAIELALNKPLWRLLAASGATHWWCMPNNDDDDVKCHQNHAKIQGQTLAVIYATGNLDLNSNYLVKETMKYVIRR